MDDSSFSLDSLFGGSDTTATDFSDQVSGTVTPSTSLASSNSSSWGSLDSLGSTASGIAASILGSAGSLITGQINNQALLNATGAQVQSTQALATANPNKWQGFLLAGVAVLGIVLVINAVRK